MAQGIFNWLNQSTPPSGFTDYQYPESGDVRGWEDADPANMNPNITPYEGPPQRPPADPYTNEGVMQLPGEGYDVYRQPAPDPSVLGNENNVDSWDYTSEIVPVYAVPPELGGGEYVGDLKWAPSLPQNLQPIRYVKVPRMERLT